MILSIIKRVVFAAFVMASVTHGKAQGLEVSFGKAISSYKYSDSNNTSLENLQAATTDFMSIGYRTRVFHDNIHVLGGLSYASYDAMGSDDAFHNFMEWNTTYIGIYGGIDYKIACYKKASLYLKGRLSPEFLVQGTQTLNKQVFNLVGRDDFESILYFYRIGTFINYPISESTKLTVQYLGGNSLNALGESSSDNEKLTVIAHQLSFGLQIDLNFKKQEKQEK